MKKLSVLLVVAIILATLSFSGCSTGSSKADVKDVEFVLDGKYGVKDLAYGLSYSEVCKALGLDEKETNDRDYSNLMEDGDLKAEYNFYVKPEQKYNGKDADLTIQFCDDALYGLSYSFTNLTEDDYTKMLDDLKAEFGEPEDNSFDVYEVYEWKSDDTKLQLSKFTGEDYIQVQLGVVDMTKSFNYMMENK